MNNVELRDYFAGQALSNVSVETKREITRKTGDDFAMYNSVIASICYAQADAMLAERAKGVPQ